MAGSMITITACATAVCMMNNLPISLGTIVPFIATLGVFVVPLCANIHMAGSMITITACATAVCMMNNLPISLGTIVPFIATLGVAMVASPGAPGGSIMTALPFLYMVGLGTEELQAIMIALYITQDSFGTACNVSGDNIMTALPFLYMVGLGTEELQAIMIALYITQDSFGTACNVSGDNAIGVIVDTIYKKWIKK